MRRRCPDGSWGYFYTLGGPDRRRITTEQALRRLAGFGYTIEDEPVQKAVAYMSQCLERKMQIPDRREKLHDWDIGLDLILSTWIRRFTNDHAKANLVSATWADIVTRAFSQGGYVHEDYTRAYASAFGMKPKGGRFVDFVSFYQVSLLSGSLDENTESRVFDYILNKQDGIYYIYGRQLSVLPDSFASLQSSRYLGAIELLSRYRGNLKKLQFVSDWIRENQSTPGRWDMGSSTGDHVYFPLSDSWRKKEDRENDCTYRVRSLLSALE